MRSLHLAVFAVTAGVALLSPPDVLAYPFARGLVDTVEGVVPMMHRLTMAYFPLSQVAQLYFAVMWLLSPLLVAWAAVATAPAVTKAMRTHSLNVVGVVLLAVPVLAFVFFVGLDPAAARGRYAYLILQTRPGMAVFGWAYFVGFAFFVSTIGVWAKNLNSDSSGGGA